jgi:hypothetical protein
MNDQTVAGLHLTTDGPVSVDDDLVKLVTAQKLEIEELGCMTTAVHISGEGVPPRFFITFAPDKPSFQVRGRLEDKQYDVGQQMGDTMLRFYVSKRVSKGTGWTV